jgi:hypothetical protein
MSGDDLCARVSNLWDLPVVSDAKSLNDFLSVVSNRLPHGPIAKLEAIVDGVTPPGWDALAVMERLVGGELSSWSCHAHATVMAELLRWQGVDACVDVTHRRDAASPPVDFHSVVRVRLGGQTYLCDPYHAVGAVLLVRGCVTGGLHGLCDATGDRYAWCVKNMRRETTLIYAEVAAGADAEFLRALCDVSVVLSGVTLGYKAFVKTLGGVCGIESLDGNLWELHVAVENDEKVVVLSGLGRDEAFALLSQHT